MSTQCWILNISQPYGPPRPVAGIAFTLECNLHKIHLIFRVNILGVSFFVFLELDCMRGGVLAWPTPMGGDVDIQRMLSLEINVIAPSL
jgi:hypothetical protein